ncbi:O-antigen ligase family protein [Terribacillus sp. AE2B 122]|uniref:O-antigen ligase family protein n=1 Tax=Terribacillus sp. AE2B 122 TaxID=1331902 RepID=UPI001440BA81|nr:O-antigen ligase family protein [Terribacillus sp. AE2B 122]VVM35128.1 hypothetical protein [Terribacillus sp. AE2B 122]
MNSRLINNKFFLAFIILAVSVFFGTAIPVISLYNQKMLIELFFTAILLIPTLFYCIKGSHRIIPAVFYVWILAPFFRRICDWLTGAYSDTSLIIVAPYVACFILFVPLLGSKYRITKKQKYLMVSFLVVVGYGLLYGVLNNGTAALYQFLAYFAPVTILLYILIKNPSNETRVKWINRLVSMAVLVSIYGWIQFLFVPPWDAFWMQSVEMNSIGRPLPLEVRMFSTLNAPGVTALFLGAVLVAQLSDNQFSGRWGILKVIIIISALAITLVRSAWIMVAIAFLASVFILSKKKKFKSLFLMATMGAFLFLVVPHLPGGDIIASRANSFQSLGQDTSFNARISFLQSTLQNAIASNPLGYGLGGTGVGTKLGSDGGGTSVFDNGYLDIIYTFGVVFGTFLIIVFFKIRGVIKESLVYDNSLKPFSRLAYLTLVCLFVSLLAGNSFTGIFGLVFWLFIGISLNDKKFEAINQTELEDGKKPKGVKVGRKRIVW